MRLQQLLVRRWPTLPLSNLSSCLFPHRVVVMVIWLFTVCCILRRAGEVSAAELEQLMVIVANPRTFKIPDWFLNRQKDHKDGRNSQLTSSALDTKLRDDLERLKKIRCGVWSLTGHCRRRLSGGPSA